MRRSGPAFLTTVAGLFVLLAFFVPHGLVSLPAAFLQTSAVIVMAFGFVLGGVQLLRVNLDAVIRRHEGWPYRLVLVVALVATVATGLVEGPGFLEPGTRARWIHDTLYAPLTAAFLALLAFLVASAAFRAFRVRTAGALLFAAAALIVILGRVPLGDTLTRFLPPAFRLPALEQWIMDVPQAAAKRAILMGAAVGVIATGFRLLTGLERPHLGAEEEP